MGVNLGWAGCGLWEGGEGQRARSVKKTQCPSLLGGSWVLGPQVSRWFQGLGAHSPRAGRQGVCVPACQLPGWSFTLAHMSICSKASQSVVCCLPGDLSVQAVCQSATCPVAPQKDIYTIAPNVCLPETLFTRYLVSETRLLQAALGQQSAFFMPTASE